MPPTPCHSHLSSHSSRFGRTVAGMETLDRKGWRRAARKFIGNAFHPPWLKGFRWVWTGITVLAVLGPAIISAALAVAPSPVLIGFSVTVVVGLFLMEGIRLQKTDDDRLAPRFSCTCSIERIGVPLTVGETEMYKHNAILWARIQNDGPPGEFSARLLRFRGLPGPHAEPFYEVTEAAWEHDIKKSIHMARGDIARIKIGAFSMDPRALWFYGARSATWAPTTHQAGWRFAEFSGECHFDFVIHNETDDLTRTVQAIIRVRENGTLGFRIDDGHTNLCMHEITPDLPVLAGVSGLSKVEATVPQFRGGERVGRV